MMVKDKDKFNWQLLFFILADYAKAPLFGSLALAMRPLKRTISLSSQVNCKLEGRGTA